MSDENSGKTVLLSKKVCMLGTFGVGKTSLVKRYVHGLFDDAYLSTIGVQIYEKTLPEIRDKTGLRLIIWDLANIEKITPAISSYFTGASGAIVVTDLTRPETLDPRRIHLKAFMTVNTRAVIVFAGNKVDLAHSSDPSKELLKLAQEFRSPHLLTSAKDQTNVAELFQALGKLIHG